MNSNQKGTWEIKSTDAWDKDFLDMVEKAHIFIDKDGSGKLVFGALSAEVDGAYYSNTKRYEFSWSGIDEGDPVSGRGWVEFDSNRSATGHIYFPMGEESSFTLRKQI